MLSGTVKAGLGRNPATVPFCAFLFRSCLLTCAGPDPGRLRDSSLSIFLRKDFSLPAKFVDSERETEGLERVEWYRGRAESSADGSSIEAIEKPEEAPCKGTDLIEVVDMVRRCFGGARTLTGMGGGCMVGEGDRMEPGGVSRGI